MFVLEKNAIDFLNRELDLRATGLEQDWDIELANADRIIEFINFYENTFLNDNEKIALGALIIGSLEDLANKESVNNEIWKKVKKLLCNNYNLLRPVIDYWSLSHEKNHKDAFAITPLLRTIQC